MDQLSFFDDAAQTAESIEAEPEVKSPVPEESKTEAVNISHRYDIGCCGLFRKCSDAKKCINTNLDIANACVYRRNLESGNIFYGKNSIYFSARQCKRFSEKIQAMDTEAKTELFKLFELFFYEKRGMDFLVCKSTPAIEELLSLGFITKSKSKRLILEQFNMKELRALTLEEREKIEFRPKKKAELLEWIIKTPAVRKKVCASKVIIEINKKYSYTLYELHRDLRK